MAKHRSGERQVAAPDYARRAHWGGQHIADAGDASMRLSLRRVPLRGGYTMGKYPRYYGVGAPLFEVLSDDTDVSFELRAADRAAAKVDVRRMYPNARFYR